MGKRTEGREILSPRDFSQELTHILFIAGNSWRPGKGREL
jgi:hypothetical protein